MNGRKCNGEQVEAVSGEPAEACRLLGRIVSPFVFVILPSRVVPPTLLPHSFSVFTARLDSADRPVPIRASVYTVEEAERVVTCNLEQFPRTSEDLVLLLSSSTSSFPIHSFVVPTPRVGSIHSPLTRLRARILSPARCAPRARDYS